MNQLKPMLLTSLKNYNRSQFVKDVTAGIIVAIIALPLSIALALASGVRIGSRYFYRHCCRICHLSPWWKQRSDCRINRCFCNHCRGDRCQKMEWTD